ncbi:ABC transporter ATP-binding protein [Collinsella provencensis]|uniref:ABC transporter ATP-binding protein n=1 Tax=Collinsella provencensis TaxID=1937461 RepID=UPI000C82550C|nr:ABC transporter ATP-binding protein [Collinsella provencensis]
MSENTAPVPEVDVESTPLLKVRGLTTAFKSSGAMTNIIEGIDFNLYPHETLAIVGESGCGKSVTSLSIMRLIQSPGKIVGGSVELEGTDLLQLSEEEMRGVRGNKVSMIFQEPMTSLNPVFTVGSQVMESFQIHQHLSKPEAREKTIEMLRLVGIPAPETVFKEYPHELSGGLRQRVMIAMALACRPRVLIADEPTTALDVTIQAQILRLLRELMDETGTATILITHDLGVVAQIATYVMVMYAGQAVEYGSVRQIIEDPLHPYTLGLLQCLPRLHEKTDRLFTIPGAVPSPDSYPAGCRFCPRCNRACERCRDERPPLMELPDGRRVRCWLYADAEGAVDVSTAAPKGGESA